MCELLDLDDLGVLVESGDERVPSWLPQRRGEGQEGGLGDGLIGEYQHQVLEPRIANRTRYLVGLWRLQINTCYVGAKRTAGWLYFHIFILVHARNADHYCCDDNRDGERSSQSAAAQLRCFGR